MFINGLESKSDTDKSLHKSMLVTKVSSDSLTSIIQRLCLSIEVTHLGTDKAGPKSYVPCFYEPLLSNWQRGGRRVLEIGVRSGASLVLWSEFFGPSAEIVGLDNRSDPVQEMHPAMRGRNCRLVETDAYVAVPQSVTGQFDLIIDDGPHSIESQVAAVQNYLPILRQQGVLVVEDLQQGFWSVSRLVKHLPQQYRSHWFVVDNRSRLTGHDDMIFGVFAPGAENCCHWTSRSRRLRWRFLCVLAHARHSIRALSPFAGR